MVDGYLKLLYPNGNFSKEDVIEVLEIALEMRRRVKEQLKKLGGMGSMMLISHTSIWKICQSITFLYLNRVAESLFLKVCVIRGRYIQFLMASLT